MATASTNPKQLSALQQALFVVQTLKSKLAKADAKQSEPIAIIGMGCRFPGGADNPESFWQILQNGTDTVTQVPPERWSLQDYYDPEPDTPGKMYMRSAGFLQQVDQFDPQFFGIAPREAMSLDPQQRLLLEVTWEALEHAGLASKDLQGTKTGTFIGIGQNDYAQVQDFRDPTNIDVYSASGNGFSFAAGRLSYVLGLQGPNLALDTACSSSLVALHYACQSLRQGECEQALAGGVQLILSPEVTVGLSRMRALSPDGRCKTFDARADGYGRGEGCGVIVLKRLSDAIAANDNILAVIRGSAVNHNGASSGLTVPNGVAQRSLIEQALHDAQVHPADIGYIEAHGTGTALGDPIELEALNTIFSQTHSQDKPLRVGSVKTNVGHLEAAAGIVGLAKVILSLQHREIPPHLHFQSPNPRIPWQEMPIQIPTQLTPWTRDDKPLLAGVSSFGISGTNAHVILEEAPAVVQETTAHVPQLLTLSAKTETALQTLVQRYGQHLENHPDLSLSDLCYTSQVGRNHFPHRLAVVATDRLSLQAQLSVLAQGDTGQAALGVVPTGMPQVAFLFTGQGSQYANMGHFLFDSCRVFRRELEECDRILQDSLETPLLEVLYGNSHHLLDQTAYTQPALFALEYALAKVWLSWGIVPTAVIGHSVGEFVAACIAGVFSLEDGLKLVAHRGRLMQALPSNGAMLAVLASLEQIQPYLDKVPGTLTVAGHNGPSSLVLSGETGAVEMVEMWLDQADIKTKRLMVSHGFHSPLMEPMVTEFREIAETVTYHPPQISLVSNLTGQLADADITTPDYWCEHILKPVRFAEGMAALSHLNLSALIEVGPHPVLLGMGRSCVSNDWADQVGWLPSLRRDQADWPMMLEAIAGLYIRGLNVDWQALSQGLGRRVPLPTYPFQRQRHWVDTNKQQISDGSTNGTANIFEGSAMRLLRQGNLSQLTQWLSERETFTKTEQPILKRVLESLIKHQQSGYDQRSIENWLYQIQWQLQPGFQTPSHSPPSQETPFNWLVFVDQGGVGKQIGERLKQQGHTVSMIQASTSQDTETSASQTETGFIISPNESAEFDQVLTDLYQHSATPIQGVIYLWNLDRELDPAAATLSLDRELHLGCGGVLHLLQALLRLELPNPPRLWIVTQGVAAIETTKANAVQAPLWGLGRVLSLEHPDYWGGLIDLSSPELQGQTIKQEAANVVSALFKSDEDQIALRGGHRYVARLNRQKPSPTLHPIPVVAEGTYLITGGLGALGLWIAQWLIELGAKHLVLTGRRAPSSQAEQHIQGWQQAGVQVLAASVDVTEAEAMAALMTQISSTSPPLRGIIHAAGVPGYQPIEEIDAATLHKVLQPKIQGTWLLHTLSLQENLDFFVMFSSIAAIWGSKGQAHYAAANAFLDSFADYRRSLGLPALSVSWGPWGGGGMTSSDAQQWLTRMGIHGLEPDGAIAALEYLLRGSADQATVASVDWSIFKGLYEARGRRPLLTLLQTEAAEATTQAQPQTSAFIQKLLAAPKKRRSRLLITHLQQEVAGVLGFPPSQLPAPDQGFFDMGMDSLTAIELKSRLDKSLGLSLPATIAFETPTIADLARYLEKTALTWKDDSNGATIPAEEASTSASDKTQTVATKNESIVEDSPPLDNASEDVSEDTMEASITDKLDQLETLLRGL